MNWSASVVVLFSVAVLGAACRERAPVETPADIQDIKARLESLENQLATAQVDIITIQSTQEQFKNSFFDPGEGKGYGRIDAVSGIFLVSLQNVQPYLDGVRVTLNVGNVQYARYPGFKITAKYGRRFPKFDKTKAPEERRKEVALYNSSTREKTISFTETLQPGTWNRINLVLPDINPSEFGRLELAIETDTVSLTTTKR